MPRINVGKNVPKKPLDQELDFDVMFRDDGYFLDDIPLEELRKHMKQTKSYHKIKRRKKQ
ncbi:hypothetical protein [Pseudalkalibacillus berkeleyi]|uniref:Uncharacterized protein n=1 Tax=Pseudalkalibacillus berkeleyi TaxID=1069813 RepID=A0ABS9H5H4_9BACL|nr:hypothetical protein [Pseudalkalibacillus berkeleyi]MCF6139072.1 hypothetical protein [Pseudalkalibacillus berkeleyi]